MKQTKALAYLFIIAVFSVAYLVLRGTLSRPIPIQTYGIVPGSHLRLHETTGSRIDLLNSDGTVAIKGYWDQNKHFRLVYVADDVQDYPVPTGTYAPLPIVPAPK